MDENEDDFDDQVNEDNDSFAGYYSYPRYQYGCFPQKREPDITFKLLEALNLAHERELATLKESHSFALRVIEKSKQEQMHLREEMRLREDEMRRRETEVLIALAAAQNKK